MESRIFNIILPYLVAHYPFVHVLRRSQTYTTMSNELQRSLETVISKSSDCWWHLWELVGTFSDERSFSISHRCMDKNVLP